MLIFENISNMINDIAFVVFSNWKCNGIYMFFFIIEKYNVPSYIYVQSPAFSTRIIS